MTKSELQDFMFKLGWKLLSECSDADLYGCMLGSRSKPRDTVKHLLELAGHRVFDPPDYKTPLYLYVYHEYS